VKSRTTPEFWDAYADLPADAQRLAVRAFATWRRNERHPGLHFRRIHATKDIWSVRIRIHYRAIGRLDTNTVTWFWIGSHADYDRLVG
jgi:hypothetical protein